MTKKYQQQKREEAYKKVKEQLKEVKEFYRTSLGYCAKGIDKDGNKKTIYVG